MEGRPAGERPAVGGAPVGFARKLDAARISLHFRFLHFSTIQHEWFQPEPASSLFPARTLLRLLEF